MNDVISKLFRFPEFFSNECIQTFKSSQYRTLLSWFLCCTPCKSSTVATSRVRFKRFCIWQTENIICITFFRRKSLSVLYFENWLQTRTSFRTKKKTPITRVLRETYVPFEKVTLSDTYLKTYSHFGWFVHVFPPVFRHSRPVVNRKKFKSYTSVLTR